MKKKIIFMIINLNIGGTEKALLNMISEIPKDKFEITILMLEEYGGFLDSVPGHVSKMYLKKYKDIKDLINQPPQLTSINYFKKGNIFAASSILFIHLLSKIRKDRGIFFKYAMRNFQSYEGEYDLAVAYAGPMDFISYFVINKIKADKKIQWIHFDVTKVGFDRYFASKVYRKYEKIFVVSKEGKEKLVDRVPAIKDKTEVFTNLVSSDLIHHQARKGIGFSDNFNGIRILTVGRLTNEKGQDLAIKVLAMLINQGYKVRWYCVGDGNSRNRYERMVKEFNLNESFIFLGSDPNPYPYIAQCDIYVQPSRHEGYCITLAEAKCLAKPIITTNFTGASEQLKNGETGLIVSCNENDIFKAVVNLLNNHRLREAFSRKLSEEIIDPSFEVNRIMDFQSQIG